MVETLACNKIYRGINTFAMNLVQSISGIVIKMAAILIISSCNTNEGCDDLGTCPQTDLTERTDIIIRGDLSISDNQIYQVVEGEEGPVGYNFYGNPSSDFDFIIDLSDGYKLIIRMYDAESLSPWDDVDIPYNIYPHQELSDRLKYVTADLQLGNDAFAYSSSFGEAYPRNITLDVFKITSYDGQSIKSRIRDLVLYKNTDGSQLITINGTFTLVMESIDAQEMLF